MTWVRRDDQASIHRKVAPLDDATYRLWSEAIEWCSRNGTDGLIAADELRDVSKRGTPPRAATLVQRRLWHQAGDPCGNEACPPPSEVAGWRIHDYLDYNPSRAEVRAELKAKAERTRRWRERKAGDGVRDASRDASQARHVTDTRRARDASPGDASPSRPVPPRPEGGGSGTAPGRLAAAGTATRPGDEPTSTTSASPKCPRCMNPADSNYHQRVCAPSEAQESP